MPNRCHWDSRQPFHVLQSANPRVELWDIGYAVRSTSARAADCDT